MTQKKRYPGNTLDNERTYAADVDMKGDPAELARHKPIDEQRAGDSPEMRADDALASAAGKAGQT